LVVSRPERALELAVPESVRQAMPSSVQALLEETVNGAGDYEVLCGFPDGEPDVSPAMFRSATINGERMQVFTFGKALEYLTHATAR